MALDGGGAAWGAPGSIIDGGGAAPPAAPVYSGGVIYAVNGVPLHDERRGWRVLRAGTNTQGGVTNVVNRVPIPGRPGYAPAPGTFTEQLVIFNIRTTRAGLEPLLALLASARTLTRTDDAERVARVELASAIPSSSAPLDATHDVTATFNIYDGVWRDVDQVIDGPTSITTPSQSFVMLPGLSAPIWDMDIFIRGVFGEFTLTDSGGSFLKTIKAWPGSASTGILYIGSTGQAFLANESSPWVPVSDASQYIDVSGNGGFRITPKLVGDDPASRRAELTLTTLTQTSTTLRVRAKRAYRMN